MSSTASGKKDYTITSVTRARAAVARTVKRFGPMFLTRWPPEGVTACPMSYLG
jgi:hypothetical protein